VLDDMESLSEWFGDPTNVSYLALLLIMVPALLFSGWVKKRFQEILNRYLRIASRNGFTGFTAVRRLLDKTGVRGVRIVPTTGPRVSDHYHPLTRVLALSTAIYGSSSLAALAIATHEVGHAVQHARGSFLVWLRTTLVPLTRVCFYLGLATVFFGMIYASTLVWAGLAFFACCFLFPLVNVAIEFDASTRARKLAVATGIIAPEEEDILSQVHHAAALTYVAQAVQAGFAFAVLVVFLGFGLARPELLGADGDSNVTLLAVGLGFFAVWLCRRTQRAKAAPPDARQLNHTGNLLANQGELAEAIAAFSRALRLEPSFAEAYANRGATYFHTGQLDEALADLDTAIRLAPGAASSYLCRGHVRARRSEFDGALADYEEALRREPHHAPIVWLSRACILTARGEYDEAIRAGTEALNHGCARAPGLRDRGLAWFLKGDLDRAVADLDESIRLDPGDGVAFNNRGAALLRRGDYARAAADLHEAIRLSPQLPNPYKHLAWLQATCPALEFRNGTEAVANAARAFRLANGQAGDWRLVLAAAHAEAGDFAEASRIQAECLREAPPEKGAELQARLDLYRAGQPLRAGPQHEERLPAQDPQKSLQAAKAMHAAGEDSLKDSQGNAADPPAPVQKACLVAHGDSV
jgi:Zn-dependent membrane protease YugP/Flp pilus assembly protein TadD